MKALIEEHHISDDLNPFIPGSKPRIYDTRRTRHVGESKVLRPGTLPGFPPLSE